MTTPTHSRLVRTLTALGLATVLAVATAGVAGADSSHHRGHDGGGCASGRLSAFDYSQGGQGGYVMAVTATTLTVESWDGTTTTFTLTPTTTYTENNQTVAATNLVVGDRVEVQTTTGTTTATSVTIELAELLGIVSTVNGNTVAVIGPEGFTRTILVNAQTTYTEGGQPSSLAAVTQGTRIVAKGTIDVNQTSLDALSITIDNSMHNTRVSGVVTSFTSSSITLSERGGASATYTLTTSTTFTEGHVATTSAALADGERVGITVSSAAPTTAVSVNIGLVRIGGVVSGLTTDGFTVTIHNNLQVSVIVGTSTTFKSEGQPSTIASVLVGVRVRVVGALSADGTTLDAQSVTVEGNGNGNGLGSAIVPSGSGSHNNPGGSGFSGRRDGWGGHRGRGHH